MLHWHFRLHLPVLKGETVGASKCQYDASGRSWRLRPPSLQMPSRCHHAPWWAGTANPSWARVVIPVLLTPNVSHQLISEQPTLWQLPSKLSTLRGLRVTGNDGRKTETENNGFNVKGLMKNTCLFTETIQRSGEAFHPITLVDEAQSQKQMVLIARTCWVRGRGL